MDKPRRKTTKTNHRFSRHHTRSNHLFSFWNQNHCPRLYTEQSLHRRNRCYPPQSWSPHISQNLYKMEHHKINKHIQTVTCTHYSLTKSNSQCLSLTLSPTIFTVFVFRLLTCFLQVCKTHSPKKSFPDRLGAFPSRPGVIPGKGLKGLPLVFPVLKSPATTSPLFPGSSEATLFKPLHWELLYASRLGPLLFCSGQEDRPCATHWLTFWWQLII